MAHADLKKDIELLYEVGCLRFIPRTWRQFLSSEVANVAEHTLRVIMVALLLAKREGVKDIGKVVLMALLHDLPESRAGDVNYLSRQFNKQFEDKALSESLEGTSLEDFKEIWQEYERRESLEAKIVKDADNLDVELELQEQSFKGNKVKEYWHENRKKVFTRLYTQTAKDFWQALQDSNPHDWHLHGSNRFNAGDWRE